jgi:hypothetical protein
MHLITRCLLVSLAAATILTLHVADTRAQAASQADSVPQPLARGDVQLDFDRTRDANWIALDIRTSASPQAQSPAAIGSSLPAPDHQHDFDFEFGVWKTHLKRLLHPLTGSKTWIEYDGTTTVKKVWNGRANLVELEVDGPKGHIEALSLRLYNPQSQQWSLNFANSAEGTAAIPSIGEFKGGRGEFIDQESFGTRSILVRFVITQKSPTVCEFEQSYSDDGGKSWELNWVAEDTLFPGSTE